MESGTGAAPGEAGRQEWKVRNTPCHTNSVSVQWEKEQSTPGRGGVNILMFVLLE